MGANFAQESNLSNTATLTSLDLADITGSRHDNVQRSIKRSVQNGKVSMPPSEKGPVGKNGREVKYYVFRGDKGKRDSFRVLERMTASQADAIAARWRELEEQPAQVAASMLTTRVSHTPQADQAAEAVRVLPVTRIVSPGAGELTMSSLEIHELTGKNHADVMRDIRKMLEELGTEGQSKFAGSYVSEQNKVLPCYQLPRRETDILLTGYSITMRAVVIDRWHQLEAEVAKPAFSVPTSFAEALRLAGELEEQRVALTHKVGIQAAKIAEDAPKAQFHDEVAIAKNSHSMKQVADILKTGRNKLFKYLRKHGVLLSDGINRNLPYQRHKDGGRFIVHETTRVHPDDPSVVMVDATTFVTGKGLIWIQQFIEQHGRVGL